MNIFNKEISRKNVIVIFTVLAVAIIVFGIVFIIPAQKEKALAPSEVIQIETLEKKLEDMFGKGYLIKNREEYEGYEKLTIDLSMFEVIPTPQSEAVIFLKNEKIVPMPESYAKKVIADDMQKTGNKGELVASKYFEEFSGFNDGKTYKNVYVNSIKLETPAPKESNMIPGDLNYEVIVIDEFGNILFRAYSTQAY